MSQIKDKIIKVYAVTPERDIYGNEIKVKRYIHGIAGLHAYARELLAKDAFFIKTMSSDVTTIFRVNYNAKLKTGLYLDFNNETFVINAVDGYEFYKQDLTLRCKRIRAEVFEHEEYDAQ
jgi:hypothetical protein